MKPRLFLFVLLSIASLAGAAVSLGGAHAPQTAESRQLVLVGGATGRTGYRIVQLLQAASYRVRGLTRDRARAEKTFGDDIEWIEADVRDPDSLVPAFAGVSGFINATGTESRGADNTPEQINYRGMQHLVDAAKNAGVNYFSWVSSGGVTNAEEYIAQNRGDSATWTFRGEEYLRASGLDYTIVRAAGMRDFPAGENGILLLQHEDTPDAVISRSDVAAVMVECLFNEHALNKTFYIANYLALDPESWRAHLARLRVD